MSSGKAPLIYFSMPQALGSKAVPVADESRAQAIADFINIIRNNRGPLATAQDLASGPCQRDDTRLVRLLTVQTLQLYCKIQLAARRQYVLAASGTDKRCCLHTSDAPKVFVESLARLNRLFSSLNPKHDCTSSNPSMPEFTTSTIPSLHLMLLKSFCADFRVYAQNIRDLQACGKLEEMHDYIMRAVSTCQAFQLQF